LQCELVAVFVDLGKAFDTADRCAVWQILLKIGCLTDFANVNIIRYYHEGTRVRVIENYSEKSPVFDVTNDIKQGCFVAPLLFIMLFSMRGGGCGRVRFPAVTELFVNIYHI